MKLEAIKDHFMRLKNMPKPQNKAPKNNFINFGGGEGENQFYENLRKQYNMGPDATYDEIFNVYMEKSGNKFTNGPAEPKKPEPKPEDDSNNKYEDTKGDSPKSGAKKDYDEDKVDGVDEL